jgi:hypothetical protein
LEQQVSNIRYAYGFLPGSEAERTWAVGGGRDPIWYSAAHVFRTVAGAEGEAAERAEESGYPEAAYLFECELTGETDHKGRVGIRRVRIVTKESL